MRNMKLDKLRLRTKLALLAAVAGVSLLPATAKAGSPACDGDCQIKILNPNGYCCGACNSSTGKCESDSNGNECCS